MVDHYVWVGMHAQLLKLTLLVQCLQCPITRTSRKYEHLEVSSQTRNSLRSCRTTKSSPLVFPVLVLVSRSTNSSRSIRCFLSTSRRLVCPCSLLCAESKGIPKDAMSRTPEKDATSFFQVGGIHGAPYVPWPGVSPDPNLPNLKKGYCTHGSVLFPTWHRPYVVLYEVCASTTAVCLTIDDDACI